MEAPPLSPFPNIKQQPASPRRISQQHSVYVSPHKNGACLTPRTALLYKFDGSPSKVEGKKVERGQFERGLINLLIRMCWGFIELVSCLWWRVEFFM